MSTHHHHHRAKASHEVSRVDGFYHSEPHRPKATFALDGYEEDWQIIRKALGRAFSSSVYDVLLCLVIIANMVVIVIETDQEASRGETSNWVAVVNYIFIGIYSLEVSVRIWIYRSLFLQDVANVADVCIVSVDVCVEIVIFIVGDSDGMPSVVVLRMFRFLRLGRTHRVLSLFPELHFMVMGLAGAAKAIFWGMILILVMLLIFGILAVQIIHPLNKEVAADGAYSEPNFCSRCPRAFESVPAAMLTFTQHIIAGDSWGAVAIPIIERYPESYCFFILVMVSLGLAVLNLILAVVMDCAASARKETDHMLAKQKTEKFKHARAELLQICAQMDTDNSGSLNMVEIQEGFRTNSHFADAMSVLDVKADEMEIVYEIMDEDRSGEVRFEDFVEKIYNIKTRDSHTMLVFILHAASELKKKVLQEFRMLKGLVQDRPAMSSTLGASSWAASDNALSLLSKAEESPKTVSAKNVKPWCDAAMPQEGDNDAIHPASQLDRMSNQLHNIELTLDSLVRSCCSAELHQSGLPLLPPQRLAESRILIPI